MSFISFAVNSQSSGNNNSGIDTYLITEACLIRNDSIIILKDLVDTPSHVVFFLRPSEDSSIYIGLDKGRDRVLMLGNAKTIENPGSFEVRRNDAEFYNWSYLEGGVEEEQDATVFKEYITESFEKSGRKYFFFRILFKGQQLLINGYKIDNQIDNHN